jgi:hypothetical protein
MVDVCECSPGEPLPRRNLMDTTIGSSKQTPKWHRNRLPEKPWRFRCQIFTVEKRFPKRNPKKKKKKTTSLRQSLKPKRIGFTEQVAEFTLHNRKNTNNSSCKGGGRRRQSELRVGPTRRQVRSTRRSV